MGPSWAQGRHAAVQRIKFEPRPEGSRSRKAESLSFSAGWLDDRTFGSGKQPSDELVRNDGTEPRPTDAAVGTNVWFRCPCSKAATPKLSFCQGLLVQENALTSVDALGGVEATVFSLYS